MTDKLRFNVFIETPCICDHSTTMEIDPIDWADCETDEERSDLLAEYAQQTFYETCNYGWSEEPINGDDS